MSEQAAFEGNPYPGPSPFTEAYAQVFFGRADDIEALRALLRTERIVVLHAPSGAGKTSLIQAGLLPRLENEGFLPLAPVRVGTPLPPEGTDPGANRFTYSIIKGLEDSLAARSKGKAVDGSALVGLRLSNYFEHRSALRTPDQHTLLVFDQFEELFTADARAHRQRVEFFNDLAEVLHDRHVWALFAMREEYVAALDRYKRLVPTQLEARYHLDFLSPDAARQAVQGPARTAGVPFTEDALDRVLDDLVRTGLGYDAGTETQDDDVDTPLDVIDPLHLQLVCTEVWRARAPGAPKLTAAAVDAVRQPTANGEGGLNAVDVALMHYYDGRVAQAADHPGCTERRVREWIEDELIERGRYRRQDLAASADSDPGLAFAQRQLDKEHILRPTVRLRVTWYEIAHDRMVEPIRRSNDAWFRAKLTAFERNARLWALQHRPMTFEALPRSELPSPRRGASLEALTDVERAYLEFCNEKNAKGRTRRLFYLLLGCVGFMLVAYLLQYRVQREYYENSLEDLGEQYAQKAEERQALVRQTEILAKQHERLEEAVAVERRRRAELAEQTARERERGIVLRLLSNSIDQRLRQHRHDVALLLGRLAIERNAKIADPDMRVPPLSVESTVWPALEARPFSHSIPAPLMTGPPAGLAPHPDGVRILMAGGAGAEVDAVVDLRAGTIRSAPRCRDAPRAYSGDGSQMALVDAGVLLVLAADTCRELARRVLPAEPVAATRAPAWSGGDRWLGVFMDDGSVIVQSVADAAFPGRRITASAGEGERRITVVAVAEEGIAVGENLGHIRLFPWSAAEPGVPVWEWRPLWPYGDLRSRPEHAEVVALEFVRADGVRWLAAAHGGGLPTRGGRLFVHGLGERRETSYEIRPDLRSRVQESVEREAGRLSDRRSGEAFTAARFAADGRWVVTAGKLGTVARWDLAAPQRDGAVFEDPVEEEGVWRGELTAHELRKVQAYVVPRRLFRGLSGAPSSVSISTDGDSVYAVDPRSEVRAWRLRPASRAFASVGTGGNRYLYALAFDERGRLVSADNRGRLRRWTIESNPLSLEDGEIAEMGKSVRSLSLKAGHAVVGMEKGEVSIVTLDGRYPELELASDTVVHEDGLWSSAFRPGDAGFGARFDLATGDHLGRVIFWDLEHMPDGAVTQHREPAFLDFTRRAAGLSFHPSGRWLAVGTLGGRVAVVDMEGGCEGARGPCEAWSDDGVGAGRDINAAAFSPDGRLLAVAGEQGLIAWFAFDSETGVPGQPIRPGFAPMAGTSTGVAFVPGTGRLVTSAVDGSLRVWDTRDPDTQPLILHGDGADLQSVAVSEHGNLVAAGDSRGRLMLWNLEALEEICAQVLRNLTWQEWNDLVGDGSPQGYDPVCPGLPYSAAP